MILGATDQKLKNKKFFGCPRCPNFKIIFFGGIAPKLEFGIL
jgi:hypothetical protein